MHFLPTMAPSLALTPVTIFDARKSRLSTVSMMILATWAPVSLPPVALIIRAPSPATSGCKRHR